MKLNRNRSTGWQYAKLSGHRNEVAVAKQFNNPEFRNDFSKRLNLPQITNVDIGGLHENDVLSVFDDKTKSKTDLKLKLEDGTSRNFSIKKSLGGQVYLISVKRFINGYEKQFGCIIPDIVKEMLYFYFYGNPKTKQILEENKPIYGQNKRLIEYQKHHDRLVWATLVNYNEEGANKFLFWLKNNIANIADFCFSKGLAKDKNDWAEYVWYINLLSSDNEDFDYIFSIDDIKNAVMQNNSQVTPGSINMGSTIQLPFGFVQWHQCQMQFHHSAEKLLTILENNIL